MTQDEIVEMAKEAGAELAELPMMDAIIFSVDGGEWNSVALKKFANLVAFAERDRNTKLLYQMHERAAAHHSYYKHAAIEINRKARSQS